MRSHVRCLVAKAVPSLPGGLGFRAVLCCAPLCLCVCGFYLNFFCCGRRLSHASARCFSPPSPRDSTSQTFCTFSCFSQTLRRSLQALSSVCQVSGRLVSQRPARALRLHRERAGMSSIYHPTHRLVALLLGLIGCSTCSAAVPGTTKLSADVFVALKRTMCAQRPSSIRHLCTATAGGQEGSGREGGEPKQLMMMRTGRWRLIARRLLLAQPPRPPPPTRHPPTSATADCSCSHSSSSSRSLPRPCTIRTSCSCDARRRQSCRGRNSSRRSEGPPTEAERCPRPPSRSSTAQNRRRRRRRIERGRSTRCEGHGRLTFPSPAPCGWWPLRPVAVL